jgi:hypothetical protein
VTALRVSTPGLKEANKDAACNSRRPLRKQKCRPTSKKKTRLHFVHQEEGFPLRKECERGNTLVMEYARLRESLQGFLDGLGAPGWPRLGAG